MIREDYIIRLIRQLVEAIARIAGFRKNGEYDRALREVGNAWELLGVPRELMISTDRETCESLLGRDPDKLRAAAELLAEEAHVMSAKGDPLNAGVLRRRAIELIASARELAPRPGDDEMIAEIGRQLPAAELSAAVRD